MSTTIPASEEMRSFYGHRHKEVRRRRVRARMARRARRVNRQRAWYRTT